MYEAIITITKLPEQPSSAPNLAKKMQLHRFNWEINNFEPGETWRGRGFLPVRRISGVMAKRKDPSIFSSCPPIKEGKG